MSAQQYDTIVIGAGHAGCEAALASARMGLQTLLITLHKDKIGHMSCNPAIGGVGKGQLVKELDALGGEMAKAADASGIQFRILNASKGPAVHSSRAQIDRNKYKVYMQRVLAGQRNLDILEDEAARLVVEHDTVKGVELVNNGMVSAKTVVVAPGTFLNGLIHVGMNSFPGGRIEEPHSSAMLSDSLRECKFRIFRFKTGTCARLDGETIDFSNLRVQNGDTPPRPFSFSTKTFNVDQVPCYVTYTNEKTHEIIRKNLDRSPLYSGKIIGTGVRYCPSLEDKVVKFSHHNRHQIFLEPEGLDTNEYYPNGLSTSLPEDVQEAFIRSVPGLEDVKINRFGYGIEHDVVDPTELFSTLETKLVRNLYLAGQINGTTGYEEAAAQGLIAGINAALRAKDSSPFVLDRSTSYIGVLIDDLVTKGTNEPYRMFTSRVEYRLILREDNADLRLRKMGFELGLVPEGLYNETMEKKDKAKALIEYLKENRLPGDKTGTSLYKHICRPGVFISDIKTFLPLDYPPDVLKEAEVDIKYSGYIDRQLNDVKNFKNLERIKMPADLDYNGIASLSREIKEKLSKFRPINLGQASRISGVTPAAIALLMVYVKKYSHGKAEKVL